MKPTEIDGTTLEGGGQLVRLAIGLSAITGRPVKIFNIRGNRPRPGLKDQHVTAVNWLAQACQAYTEGLSVGSRTLLFEPGRANTKPRPWWTSVTSLPDGSKVRVVEITLNGVGAATLVLQAILPVILFSDCSSLPGAARRESHLPVLLKLVGGTNVSFAPSVDYVEKVLFPNFALMGLPLIRLSPHHLLKRGYSIGPPTPGEMHLLIQPVPAGSSVSSIHFPESGRITQVEVTMQASPLIARQFLLQKITKLLAERCPEVAIGTVDQIDSRHEARLSLLLVAHSSSGFRVGVDMLFDGRVGRKPEAIEQAVDILVRRAVKELMQEIGYGGNGETQDIQERSRQRCLDRHMEDQVPVYMALAKGTSACGRIGTDGAEEHGPSLHTRTAQWVVGRMLGVEFDSEGKCEGIGLVSDGVSPT